jgi:hypothetical protein
MFYDIVDALVGAKFLKKKKNTGKQNSTTYQKDQTP